MADNNEPISPASAPTPFKAPIRGGGGVLAIIPQDLDQVWRLATMAVKGQMAPDSLLKVRGAYKPFDEAVASCAIAIMAGAELGLTPMAALRSYAVVNGRPTLWGDGIKAVVRQSGICEYIKTGSDQNGGWCESKRKDTGEVSRKEFTMKQADAAGLTKKDGPWRAGYADVMCERRATFRCLNDLYADVLGGIVSSEEAGDYIDVTPPARQLPPEPPEEPAGTDVAASEPEASHVEDMGQGGTIISSTSNEVEKISAEDILAELEDLLSHAADAEAVEKAFDGFDVQTKLAGNDDALSRAFAIKAGAMGEPLHNSDHPAGAENEVPHDAETGEVFDGPPDPPDESTPRAEGVDDMFDDDFPGNKPMQRPTK